MVTDIEFWSTSTKRCGSVDGVFRTPTGKLEGTMSPEIRNPCEIARSSYKKWIWWLYVENGRASIPIYVNASRICADVRQDKKNVEGYTASPPHQMRVTFPRRQFHWRLGPLYNVNWAAKDELLAMA